MTDSVLNVLLGLVASAIAAGLGWLAQTLRRRRRLGRLQAFFGLPDGGDCLLVVNRHASSSHPSSVQRNDVYALMELSGLVRECRGRAELVPHDKVLQGLGHKAEFCLGGPVSNDRTAAHLASWLPGVSFTPDRVVEDFDPDDAAISVGDETFRYVYGGDTRTGQAFVLLARLHAEPGGRPVFLISGQSAISNHAAVRYLVANHRRLARRYGVDRTFALMLRVVNPGAYGPDVVELASDVTAKASVRPAEAAA
ncbi:hypothetical protein ACGFZP_32095 [Kitasatospora sp. NPDC048239]|uniref:hypothetical protein n=1 Tax=Kitasatospora sp. NPDC048239 TaxID=3364046 RepID=UPI003716EF95